MEIIKGDSSKAATRASNSWRPKDIHRVLLLHPEDSVLNRPWSSLRWDLIVDLGWAGTAQYATWSDRLGCPVRAFYGFANWHEDVRQIQHCLGIGNDCLVDAEGVDWWRLLTPAFYQPVLEMLMLRRIAAAIHPAAEIRVTRSYPLADELAKILGVPVDPFSAESPSRISARLRASVRALRTLTPAQVLQVAADKWDTDYGVRRFFSRRPKVSGARPKVLLPSAYRNVSRVLTEYARLLPERSFMLVTTRADGIIKNLPEQVNTAPLASYAPLPLNRATEREIESLTQRWQALRGRLQHSEDALLARAADLFHDFERNLRNGLRVRDAWRNVLERERIEAVLCGDENNPYTRLPVLLAKSRGVHTIYCGHGALDCSILLRGACSDIYLAKGEMAKDYLVQKCGVSEQQIFLGAPPEPAPANTSPCREGTRIVFFSEPYELYSGRTEVLYRELLPRLCAIARQHERRVIVKLHPFESLAGRTQLVDRILDENDRKLVEVTAQPMSERLLQCAWFSVTLESSVAVECAIAGVPCFLSGWFDLKLYDYGRQYEKFGAAKILNSPEDVLRIPELLRSNKPDYSVVRGLRQPIGAEQLDRILSGLEAAPTIGVRSQVKDTPRPSGFVTS